MSGSFDDRRKGFESKWAHDAEMQFKIMARRNKLLGLWAAGEMGLTGDKADAYAKAVVASEFEKPGDEGVFDKVRGDLDKAKYSDHAIRHKMADLLEVAAEQVQAEVEEVTNRWRAAVLLWLHCLCRELLQSRPIRRPGWPDYGGDAGGQRFSTARQITPANVARPDRRLDLLDRRHDDQWRRDEARLVREHADPGRRPALCLLAVQRGQRARSGHGQAALALRSQARHAHPLSQRLCLPRRRLRAACGERRLRGAHLSQHRRPPPDRARRGDRQAVARTSARAEPSSLAPGRQCPKRRGEIHTTSAPVVTHGVVIVGSSIDDNQKVDELRGTVHAFDAVTGAPRWSFDPLAGQHAPFRGGAANVWAPMSVDEARGLVFLPVSSTSPDFWGGLRVGNGDYANSVVALHVETGEVAWSFQTDASRCLGL